ncbi:hypothetical protein [Erwinia pyrifoliae]|uniref:hypothetical protein n=1 Tax=Erwinia pyrifoliae TaxID=79967 RepID=UPI00223BA69D|nr:hypothetical protein [Erwinia pyrifoliae]MCT2385144.1 hypothetical protein [Erwinia pyrifoliae]MCU8585632.1 hypothetical protein [Erwinia pyrifoliae]
MRERPIIFNAEMVCAVLDGSKTQTRRIIKVQPESNQFGLGRITDSTQRSDIGKYHWSESNACGNHVRSNLFSCPFGAVGDRLWVRETWAMLGNEDTCAIDWNDNIVKTGGSEVARIYRASCEQRPGNYGLWSIPDDAVWKPHTDDMQYEGAWTPSIHMPRWASRITLQITGVRVERLQGISEADATAEGISPAAGGVEKGWEHRFNFRELWLSIYGDESWQANPWVWVIEFRRIKES